MEVLGKRVAQGSEDLAAAVAELQQLRANNVALAAQLKAATEGQALEQMEARVKQVGDGTKESVKWNEGLSF